MIITLMGTGTSHGIPVINCNCECCTSSNPKDQRYRSSAKIEGKNGTIIVIDTTPEFRLQAVKYNVNKLDALLLTHSHADHLHGLDDVRIYAHTRTRCSENNVSPKALPIYANKNTLNDVKSRFSYVFKETQICGGKPLLHLVCADKYSTNNPLKINEFSIIPIPMMHGILKTSGWLIKEDDTNETFAYLTDCSFIPKSSVELTKNVTHLVIDGLRETAHSTHLNFEQAIEYAIEMNAQSTYLTHICHMNTHDQINSIVKNICTKHNYTNSVQAAWDGLQIEIKN